jgi:hypothetical protein
MEMAEDYDPSPSFGMPEPDEGSDASWLESALDGLVEDQLDRCVEYATENWGYGDVKKPVYVLWDESFGWQAMWSPYDLGIGEPFILAVVARTVSHACPTCGTLIPCDMTEEQAEAAHEGLKSLFG